MGNMDQLKKITRLLNYWMKHNDEHAEIYRSWAEKASSLGKEELSETLKRLYRKTKQLNSLLKKPKK